MSCYTYFRDFPGRVVFSIPLLRGGGDILEGELFRRGSYIFSVIFSHLTKQNSDHAVAKLSFLGQRLRPERDELPGELFEGGSYFFDVGAELQLALGRGELIEMGSFSRKHGG